MKGVISFLALSFLCQAAFGQIVYEEGYFIDNDGKRTTCLIRNEEWKYNPNSFSYKLTADGEVKEASIDMIVEFGVTKGSTFRKFRVQIDKSPYELSKLTFSRNPIWETEILLLRVIVEGKADLYELSGENLRFFYNVDDGEVKQLVHKRYMATSVDAAWNDTYKQQLYNDLKCPTITMKDAEKTDYTRQNLTKFFSRFNSCDGTAAAVKKGPERKSVFSLTLRPGMTYNSLTVTDVTTGSKSEFESKPSFRVGLEFEEALPFNKGVWAIVAEPAFQMYKADGKSGLVKVDYSSIDVSVGIRRYFYPSEKSKVYVNLNGVYALPLGSTVTIGSFRFDLSPGLNVALAAGYAVNKFSVELSYSFGRGVMGDYVSYSSSYKGPALIVGYKLFSKEKK